MIMPLLACGIRGMKKELPGLREEREPGMAMVKCTLLAPMVVLLGQVRSGGMFLEKHLNEAAPSNYLSNQMIEIS
jgi:hypothetical protein